MNPLACDTQFASSDDLQNVTSSPHKPLLKDPRAYESLFDLELWNLVFSLKDDGVERNHNSCDLGRFTLELRKKEDTLSFPLV